ncbi:hypothetical protein BDW75DRAFT_244680 [Aspergillus navahoensis]
MLVEIAALSVEPNLRKYGPVPSSISWCLPSVTGGTFMRKEAAGMLTPRPREAAYPNSPGERWIVVGVVKRRKGPMIWRVVPEQDIDEDDFEAVRKARSSGFSAAQTKRITDAEEVVIQQYLPTLTKVLSIPMAEPDVDRPLHHYGVDSLAAAELRSWFAKDL